MDEMRKTVGNAAILSAVIAVVMTAVSMLGMHRLLVFMHTPEDIFDGALLHVKRDTVKLPNGNKATREWIKHPGASSVIPILPDGRIVLVRQYRYPIGRVTLAVACAGVSTRWVK